MDDRYLRFMGVSCGRSSVGKELVEILWALNEQPKEVPSMFSCWFGYPPARAWNSQKSRSILFWHTFLVFARTPNWKKSSRAMARVPMMLSAMAPCCRSFSIVCPENNPMELIVTGTRTPQSTFVRPIILYWRPFIVPLFLCMFRKVSHLVRRKCFSIELSGIVAIT